MTRGKRHDFPFLGGRSWSATHTCQNTILASAEIGRSPTTRLLKQKGLASTYTLTPVFLGSPTWARTRDLRINSPAFTEPGPIHKAAGAGLRQRAHAGRLRSSASLRCAASEGDFAMRSLASPFTRAGPGPESPATRHASISIGPAAARRRLLARRWAKGKCGTPCGTDAEHFSLC